MKTVKLFTVCLWSVAAMILLPSAQAASSKPNILFIFSDDQMPESIRAYGKDIVKTLRLDRLAAQGFCLTTPLIRAPSRQRSAWLVGPCLTRGLRFGTPRGSQVRVNSRWEDRICRVSVSPIRLNGP